MRTIAMDSGTRKFTKRIEKPHKIQRAYLHSEFKVKLNQGLGTKKAEQAHTLHKDLLINGEKC